MDAGKMENVMVQCQIYKMNELRRSITNVEDMTSVVVNEVNLNLGETLSIAQSDHYWCW